MSGVREPTCGDWLLVATYPGEGGNVDESHDELGADTAPALVTYVHPADKVARGKTAPARKVDVTVFMRGGQLVPWREVPVYASRDDLVAAVEPELPLIPKTKDARGQAVEPRTEDLYRWHRCAYWADGEPEPEQPPKQPAKK